jgi:hypothetical protein
VDIKAALIIVDFLCPTWLGTLKISAAFFYPGQGSIPKHARWERRTDSETREISGITTALRTELAELLISITTVIGLYVGVPFSNTPPAVT